MPWGLYTDSRLPSPLFTTVILSLSNHVVLWMPSVTLITCDSFSSYLCFVMCLYHPTISCMQSASTSVSCLMLLDHSVNCRHDVRSDYYCFLQFYFIFYSDNNASIWYFAWTICLQSVATFFSHVMSAIGGNTAGPG